MGRPRETQLPPISATRRPPMKRPSETTTRRRPASSAWSQPTPLARETSWASPTTSPNSTNSELPSSETRRKCSPPLDTPRRWPTPTVAWLICSTHKKVESTLSQLQRQTPKIQPKTTEEEQKKKKNNISSNQQKNISNLPTFPRTKKINISEEKKKETLKDIKRTTTNKPNA